MRHKEAPLCNTETEFQPIGFLNEVNFCRLGNDFVKTDLFRRRSQDGRRAWKFFVCLASMKYSQINTKPSCTPRKLTGGLTQQSAQPEPQNSAGTKHGEVNLGREKPRQPGRCSCVQREDGDGGEITGKAPLPKSSLERKWKIGNSRRD